MCVHICVYNLRHSKKKRALPSTDLLPKCLQQLDLGQSETRSQGFHSGLSHEWQGTKYCCFKNIQYQEVGLEVEAGLDSSDVDIPNWGCLNLPHHQGHPTHLLLIHHLT